MVLRNDDQTRDIDEGRCIDPVVRVVLPHSDGQIRKRGQAALLRR